MRVSALLLLFAALPLAARDLEIYAIDTEGGKSTLYVSPSGESMLIDAGYDGNNGRDPERVLAAIKAAKLDHIDHFVLTHYHNDHSGGVKELASKIRIDHFYDHGPAVEASTNSYAQAWQAVYQGKPHVTLKPGDRIPVKGLDVQVVAAGGQLIPHPSCDGPARPASENGENANSVAMIIAYGKFRVSDLGDLSADREYDLGCPGNKLGHVDLFMTTHHGTGTSVPPQILAALTPRVAVMNNGANKGGSVKALEALRAATPPIELWQLHYSKAGGEKLNTKEERIANSSEDCHGFGLRITAKANGSFTVLNERTKKAATYR